MGRYGHDPQVTPIGADKKEARFGRDSKAASAMSASGNFAISRIQSAGICGICGFRHW